MAFFGIESNPNAGLGAIGKNVGALVDSVIGDFLDTLTGEEKYKKLFSQDESEFKQYSTQVADRRQWHTIAKDRTVPNYYFLLEYQGKIIQIDFNINPQRETITEPHGHTTVYTQGGSKLIHSDGMVTKEITIQGTNGIYPGERRKRLPDSGKGSGFEAFKNLQNVFRRYCYLRRYGDLTKGLRLIYINRRRQEGWVVEPKVFTSEDATEHNFHFSYTIQLETLYPYEGDAAKGLVEGLLDAIPGWRQLDAVVQRLSETVDSINAAAGQISAIIDSFGTVLLSRINSLANSWADVKAGRLPNVANFKRDSVKGILFELRGIGSALEASKEYELAKKVYDVEKSIQKTLLLDEQYDPKPVTQAQSVTQTQNAQLVNYTDSQGRAISPTDAISAGNVTARPDGGNQFGGSQNSPAALPGSAVAQQQYRDGLGPNLRSSTTIGGSTLDQNVQSFTTISKYSAARFSSDNEDGVALPPSTRAIESQLNWDASWDQAIVNINPSNADYRTARIVYQDSIQTLAQRLLGDPGRWVEIVLLNNLRYPYVADPQYININNLSNVKAWGDLILYPVPKQRTGAETRVWRQETFVSLGLSPFERALGNDIKIDPDTGDIVWTANDLALCYGVDTITQFMRKRVVSRKGAFRRSLRVGYSNMIGVSDAAVEAILAAETKSIFFGDERIVSAELISFSNNGGQLLVSILARVRDAQDPIIISEALE